MQELSSHTFILDLTRQLAAAAESFDSFVKPAGYLFMKLCNSFSGFVMVIMVDGYEVACNLYRFAS
jgi:hypothetical protein